MSNKTAVSIVKVTSSIGEGVTRALDLVGGIPRRVGSGTTVLLKPNLIRAEAPSVGTTTNIEVIRAVGDLFRRRGARVIVGEASGNQYDTETIYSFLRLREQLADFEVVDLDQDRIIPVEIDGARALKRVGIAETVLEADVLVSLPVMKTHNATLFTGGMKNMMGVLPQREKWNMHLSGLHQAIVDLNRIVGPDLIVMDAIVGMEGWGPAMGYPVAMNMILAGKDVVAVDSVASRVMGIDVARVKHLTAADRQGVGTSDPAAIEIRGERLEDVRRSFRRPRGLKGFEVFGKAQYVVGRFLLNHFRLDIRPLSRSLSLFHLPKPKLNYALRDDAARYVSACPESAIHLSRVPLIDYSKCTRCMRCCEESRAGAFEVSRLPTCLLRIRNLYFSIISRGT